MTAGHKPDKHSEDSPVPWRLFFALCPPAAAREQIAAFLRENPAPGKPVPPQNWHMTVLFVGNVPPPVGQALAQRPLPDLPEPFSLCLDRCGWWPRPKVGWLAPSEPPPELLAVHRRVREQVAALGVKPDSRPYRPHVTVWKKLSRPWSCQRAPAIDWPVQRVHLVRSCLRPTGPEYRSLASWPLPGCHKS